MSLHNYYIHDDRPLMFEWGSLREDYYKDGDKLSWNWSIRPNDCDGVIYVPAIDDSIDDLNAGYYLIELKNDVFYHARTVSRMEYEEALAKLRGLM